MNNIFKATILLIISNIASAALTPDATNLNYNYEMTTQPGTEYIQPISFFDNGIATFLKFKPDNKKISLDGKEVPAPPNLMVFYIDKSGKEVVAPSHEWNKELNILAFPFIANEWHIRSGNKVVGIRKSK